MNYRNLESQRLVRFINNTHVNTASDNQKPVWVLGVTYQAIDNQGYYTVTAKQFFSKFVLVALPCKA